MSKSSKLINSSKLQYFTDDYEWIDFHGSVAFVGICKYKLIGLKSIDKLQYADITSHIKKGEVLAKITSEDYTILIHMPVDGRVIQVNDDVINQPERLLENQITNWIAKICPLAPYKRDGLISGKQYQLIKKHAYKYEK